MQINTEAGLFMYICMSVFFIYLQLSSQTQQVWDAQSTRSLMLGETSPAFKPPPRVHTMYKIKGN